MKHIVNKMRKSFYALPEKLYNLYYLPHMSHGVQHHYTKEKNTG